GSAGWAKVDDSPIVGWPGRKYLVGVVLDDGVAFAGNVFERRAVEDLDVTAAVADQAGALQEASRDGHRGAPHAEHLSEKLLRQRDDIVVDAVVRLQQPTAKSGLEAMQRIARNRLLDLRKQDIVVAHDEVAESRALGGSRMKLRGRDPRGRARQLHDRACDGRPRSQSGAGADDPGASDRCGLDRCAVLHDRHERDHAAMREIDVLDLLPDIVQHRAPLERDRAQMRRQQRKIVRRQCRQEPVKSTVLELPGKRGYAVRHRCRSYVRKATRSSFKPYEYPSDGACVQPYQIKQAVDRRVPLCAVVITDAAKRGATGPRASDTRRWVRTRRASVTRRKDKNSLC